jgi:osmotically inducible protein OsmC
MASTRTAKTHWEGALLEGGSGQVTLESSGLGTYDVSWPARTDEAANGRTSPEELIAAAHSSCFSMAPPQALDTQADVSFQPGEGITGIHITVVGRVEGVDAEAFAQHAEDAKKNCPVSQALTGTTITVDASLA